MSELIVRPAANDDLPEIATIHLQAYSRYHFTSRLPSGVLVTYYRQFLGDGAEMLVASRANGDGSARIIGFAVFGRDIGSKIARFKRENRLAIFQTAIRNPLFAARLALKRLWHKIGGDTPMSSADFLLLSIAVSPPNKGVGGVLLNSFIERARLSGVNRVGLYVKQDNLHAINAYIKLGFKFRDLLGGQFYMERAI